MPVRFRPAILIAALLVALTVAACGGGDDKKKEGGVDISGVATSAPAATQVGAGATEPAATSAAGLPTPKEGVLLDRVIAPVARLDAPVETRGINARGEMEDPAGKDAVAWYNFSEFPGYGGNAVFSGHVDWFTGELGSFGRMKDLKLGDEIVVKLSDGMEMKYKVVSSTLYESTKAPVEEIVGRTEKDSLTFITCEGTFSRSAQDYSHRRIVRAERTG
jgi:LPXTG-site transpeptidase (sortase) family protein